MAPMKTLTVLPPVETPALIVREMELSDAPALTGFMADPRYQRHIAVRFRDADEVKAFVARTVARQGDSRRQVYHLTAAEKDGGTPVGDGFLIRGRDGRVEIGWGVARQHWGRGLGTEIGQALLGLGFERLGAEVVWCKIMTANVASMKLAQRIGMIHEIPAPKFPAGGGRLEPVDMFNLPAKLYFEQSY